MSAPIMASGRPAELSAGTPDPDVAPSVHRASDGVLLATRELGNALVIFRDGALSTAARELALGVAADAEHDIVILDLPLDAPVGQWEEVVRLMPQKSRLTNRRGVRLVFCGATRQLSGLAGRWLAERLGRPVLAADGVIVPGFAGSLFVDSPDGSGWVRFQAKKSAKTVARRYPRPAWETDDLARTVAIGDRVVAEPLPGGVWLHGREDDERVRAHRDRLRGGLPCQEGAVTVVLGCPGEEDTSIDDVTRWWKDAATQTRPLLRPFRYGPITGASAATWAQVLADKTGAEVIAYAGVPVGSTATPDMHTVLEDGVLGWNSCARELAYTPTEPGENAVPPRLVSYRAPIAGAHEVSRGVFWYAPDTVVEVVPAGLWIRRPEEPGHADTVRAVPPRAARHLVIADDAGVQGGIHGRRLEQCATDVAAHLDPATRRLTELRRASTITAQPGPDQHQLPVAETPTGATSASRGLPAGSEITETPAVGARPVETRPVESETVETRPVAARAAAVRTAEPWAGETGAAGTPTVVTDLGDVRNHLVGAAPVLPVPALPVPTLPVVDLPLPVPTTPVPSVGAQVALEVPAETVTQRSPLVPVGSGQLRPAASTPRIAPAGQVSWQPIPTPQAAALTPRRGLEQERVWLKKALSVQFTTAANAVARVLSENPAFSSSSSARPQADVLADSVAVHLYLGADGDAVELPLRRAEVGPHVPFSRCVASGLARLPSHRG
ncbi:MAG: hypothetical protein ACRYF3_16240, partial [Janthinobacterium lividum]